MASCQMQSQASLGSQCQWPCAFLFPCVFVSKGCSADSKATCPGPQRSHHRETFLPVGYLYTTLWFLRSTPQFASQLSTLVSPLSSMMPLPNSEKEPVNKSQYCPLLAQCLNTPTVTAGLGPVEVCSHLYTHCGQCCLNNLPSWPQRVFEVGHYECLYV